MAALLMVDLREARHDELYDNASIVEESSSLSSFPGVMGATGYISLAMVSFVYDMLWIAPLNWF